MTGPRFYPGDRILLPSVTLEQQAGLEPRATATIRAVWLEPPFNDDPEEWMFAYVVDIDDEYIASVHGDMEEGYDLLERAVS